MRRLWLKSSNRRLTALNSRKSVSWDIISIVRSIVRLLRLALRMSMRLFWNEIVRRIHWLIWSYLKVPLVCSRTSIIQTPVAKTTFSICRAGRTAVTTISTESSTHRHSTKPITVQTSLNINCLNPTVWLNLWRNSSTSKLTSLKITKCSSTTRRTKMLRIQARLLSMLSRVTQSISSVGSLMFYAVGFSMLRSHGW